VDRRPAPRLARPANLSPDELAAVVRRASELDRVVPEHETDLDVDEVRTVLREAGVSPEAAEQALTEWRRGELAVAVPPAPVEAVGRLSPLVVVTRTVPLDPRAVRAALEGSLRRQQFAPGRDYGAAGAEWVPRAGLVAELRRKLDLRGTLLLHDVSRIRLDLAPGRPGSCALRLSADLGPYRRQLLSGLVGLPAAAGAAVSLVGIPTSSTELFVSGLPIGLAVAGGGYLSAARTLDRRKARIEESLHILLDRLNVPRSNG
jgi:hypothetical protein